MKSKLFKIIGLTILTIGIAAFGNNVNAATEVANDVTWEYEVENGKAVNVRIVEGTTYPTIINIPSSLGGCDVESIGNGENNIVNYTGNIWNPGTSGVGIKISTINIPDTVKYINAHAFEKLCEIKNVSLGNSIEKIGNYAFANTWISYNYGVDIVFPDSLKEIGESAFSLDADGGLNDNYHGIGYVAWVKYQFLNTKVIFGNNIETIGEKAFYKRGYIGQIQFSSSIKTIGAKAFAETGIETISLPDGFTCEEGIFSGCTRLTTATIEGNRSKVPDAIFENCTKLTGVTIPSTATDIGARAFKNTKLATSEAQKLINIVKIIGEEAFYSCKNITNTITVPNTMQTLGNGAFGYTSITECIINCNITKIPDALCENCGNLTNITKPNAITEIGNGAFRNCISLTMEEYNDIATNIITIGDSAFESCIGISGELKLNNTIQTLGESSFSNCSNITKVEFPSNVKTIGARAFYKNTSLDNLVLPSTISQVGDLAFSECTSLTNVQINSSKIGNECFKDCNNITKVDFNEGITSIGDYAFKNALKEITVLELPESLVTLGTNVFQSGTYKLDEVFFKNTKENITLGYRWFGRQEPIVHFGNCSHLIEIDCKLPGVKVINENNINQDEIIGDLTTSGTYGFEQEERNGKIVYKATTEGSGQYISTVPIDLTKYTGEYIVNFDLNIVTDTQAEGFISFRDSKTDIKQGGIKFSTSESINSKKCSVKLLGGNVYNMKLAYLDYDPGYIEITNLNIQNTCKSNYKYKIQVEEGVSYPDLAVQVLTEGEYIDSDIVDETGKVYDSANKTITLNNVTRNKKIIVKRISNGTDLVTRQFISKINGKELSESREPKTNKVGLSIEYLHGKYPISVNEGDFITYTIRIYNEGNIAGKANEITQYLPQGISFAEGNEVNTQYGWTKSEDGKTLKTKYLADKEIPVASEDGLGYMDVQLVCKADMSETEYGELKTILKISGATIETGEAEINIKNEEFKQVDSKLVYTSSGDGTVNDAASYVVLDLTNYEGNYNLKVNAQTTASPTNWTSANIYTTSSANQGSTPVAVLMDTFSNNKDYTVAQDYTAILQGGKKHYLWFQTYGAKTTHLEFTINSIEILETEKNSRLVTISEITDGNDQDSQPASMKISMLNNYKKEESYTSSNDTYVKGTEDDDDFENLELKLLKQVGYQLKIQKADSLTMQLLDGAKFNLLNKNKEIIATATTKNGELNFGNFSSFGEGKDVYYIEEQTPPPGYERVIEGQIELAVIKKIDAVGNVTLEIECDLLESKEDTSKYTYIPIYTKEQLAKIGTGETITIHGKECVFAQDANYILKADIDLAGSNWTPIQNMNGVLEGDNHKISNMTIVSDSYENKEIGLFAKYSGAIKNVVLENVGIQVKTISDQAQSEYNQKCAGAFIGLAGNVTIENCKVTGTINTEFENIGGFIGHSKEGNILIFENCTNEAVVTGSKNVGGLIGCSKSALDINNCTNKGNITTVVNANNSDNTGFNAAGLVGYAIPSSYKVKNLEIGYDDGSKTITLLVKNKKLDTNYTLQLEKVDPEGPIYLEGSKFNIYNKDKTLLHENIEIKNGKMDVAEIEFEGQGSGVYFIKEVQAPDGYEILVKDFVKVEIHRVWDSEKGKYVLSLTGVITNEMTDEDITNNGNNNTQGSITEYPNVRWKVNKVNIVNSTNEGTIVSGKLNAAGIIAGGKTDLKIEKCTNKGPVTSRGHAGGIAGEIIQIDENTSVNISDSVNEGGVTTNALLSDGGFDFAGIISYTNTSLELINCTNEADIIGLGGHTAGIVGVANSNAIIKDCENTAKIENNSRARYTGGIIAMSGYGTALVSDYNSIIPENLEITNCINTGNIASMNSAGGIAGNIQAQIIKVNNCKSDNITMNAQGGENAGKGGIIGRIDSEYANVSECNINNVNIITEHSNTGRNNGYGGIIGTVYGNMYIMNISNCNVTGLTINSYEGSSTGILGKIVSHDMIESLQIDNCNVSNSSIISTFRSCYGDVAGIVGGLQYVRDTKVTNCKVSDCKLEITKESTETSGDLNVAGILACNTEVSMYAKANIKANMKIENCEVINSEIKNGAEIWMATNNAAGILGYSDTVNTQINNCNLKDTKVISTAGDVGGIISATCRGETYITNTHVSGNTQFIHNAIDTQQDGLAAIVAWTDSYIMIEDCSVKGTEENNIKLEADEGTTNIAAIIASSSAQEHVVVKNTNIEFVTVKKEKQTETASMASFASGIGGVLDLENCNVSNCKVIGPSDSNISGQSSSNSISGFVGYAEKININNCNLTKTDVISNSKAQGPYGHTTGALVGASNLVNITNSNVTNCNIESNSALVGGIVGVAEDITTLSNCKVDSVNINTSNAVSPYSSVGGLIGVISLCDNTTPEISENIVNNVNIKTSTNANIGGIIGNTMTDKKIVISDCKVTNSTLQNENTVESKPYGNNVYEKMLGGMVGSATKETVYSNQIAEDSKIEFINPTVNNVSLIINEGINNNMHIGGLIGYAEQLKVTTTDSQEPIIKDVTITNGTEQGAVGGVVGIINEKVEQMPELTNLNLQNITATGKQYVAGLIGCGKAVIDNIKLSNLNLTGTQDGAVVGGAVGILIPESTIKNVTVIADANAQTPYTITSESAAGGIVGLSDVDVTNCKVENMLIKTTGEKKYTDEAQQGEDVKAGSTIESVAGEIVGILSDSLLKIVDCVHTNCIVEGN